MSEEEKFCFGALEFWKQNKELDSLHLLNKFIEEKYIPKENIIKEVRDWILCQQEHNITTLMSIDELDDILEILDKTN